LETLCKIYGRNKKTENKKRNSTKNKKRKPAAQLGPCPGPNPAQNRNSPRPTPGISETVSQFLPYLADRWTPTVRFFFLQPKRTPETEPEE
jgi:hypothetical protein